MKLTRVIFLGLAFLIPAVSTVAKAEDKPAAAEGEKPAAEGKKAKKSKKGAKEEKKEEAAPAPAEKK
jgi:hypothetical protein